MFPLDDWASHISDACRLSNFTLSQIKPHHVHVVDHLQLGKSSFQIHMQRAGISLLACAPGFDGQSEHGVTLCNAKVRHRARAAAARDPSRDNRDESQSRSCRRRACRGRIPACFLAGAQTALYRWRFNSRRKRLHQTRDSRACFLPRFPAWLPRGYLPETESSTPALSSWCGRNDKSRKPSAACQKNPDSSSNRKHSCQRRRERQNDISHI